MLSNFRQCYQVMKDHTKITNIHFEWHKRPKKRFFALLLSLVCWIDLILHIVIALNAFQLSAMLPGREGSFKDHKNAFLNDPKGQKRGFWPFSGYCFSQVLLRLVCLKPFLLVPCLSRTVRISAGKVCKLLYYIPKPFNLGEGGSTYLY